MGLEHYTRIRDLGGNNGAFLAYDRQDPSRKVVIKRLAEGPEGMTELNLSLRARHPHIVSMLEFFLHDGELFGVLKYEEGGDLGSLIARLRELEVVPREVTLLRWFEQLLSALQFCHDERRIIHRDIKPSNIFLSADDKKLFLGDFGSAKALAGGTNMTTTFVGSPMWISPEVLLGQSYTFSSDVWSLGCVFFEMATLRHPFHAQNFAHLVTKVTSGETAALPAAVPASVRAIIIKMLCFEPAARASARDLLSLTRAALPIAEANEQASRRSSSALQSASGSPTKAAAATGTATATAAATAAARHASPKPNQPESPPAKAVSATHSPASKGNSTPPPPPPSGLRTCTPTQMNAPSVSSAASSTTHAPASTAATGGSPGAAVVRKQVRSTKQAAPAIPSLVVAAEPASAPRSPGHLRRQLEERLNGHSDSDSDSDSESGPQRGAERAQPVVVEARGPLLVQGRRLSTDPAAAEASAGRANSGSHSRRGSLLLGSNGRDKSGGTGSAGSRSSASAGKTPSMRQRWYDRNPKPNAAAPTSATSPGAARRTATQSTTLLNSGKTLGGSADRRRLVQDVPPQRMQVIALAEPPEKPAVTTAQQMSAALPSPGEAEPGTMTWLAHQTDEVSDIELYLRKFRDHDDAVLRTYDERNAQPPADTAATASAAVAQTEAAAVPREKPCQPSRRAAAAAGNGVNSPPRPPRKRAVADTPVTIVTAGGGTVYKPPPAPPPRSVESSPSPKPSAVRVRPGASSALRRQRKPPSSTSSNASPSQARYASPKYERQPSSLRAPIVASHNPRQVSHARPPPQYSEAEKHAMEAGRQEAKEKRDADRERMKEKIKAQRTQQKRRNSVDVEIRLPDDAL